MALCSLDCSYLRSAIFHSIHCICFVTWILVFQAISGVFPFPLGFFNSLHLDYSEPVSGLFRVDRSRIFDPYLWYGLIGSIVLYAFRLISLMSLPLHVVNSLGLICFNAFKNKIRLLQPLLPIQNPPFLCFRVVTRGDYPELVTANVIRNLMTANSVGLSPTNFIYEVVTDRSINLSNDEFPSVLRQYTIREVVVPSSYTPSSGARFKARALQYCLEEGVNDRRDNDWIVHLDEETLLSANSLNGILNFCEDGCHQFGQGVIYYARNDIVNWITTLSDSLRVSGMLVKDQNEFILTFLDDFGKLRFSLRVLHLPFLNWKGSFMVAKAGAERRVKFDHGPEGSIAEDCFFGMVAISQGYSFNFIEGEMDEKSPFTVCDYIRQRKRWYQGIRLTVHSSEIPFWAKFGLAFSFYSWTMMPFTAIQIIVSVFFPLPKSLWLDIPSAFLGAVFPYLYFFGVVRSFSYRIRSFWQILWMPIYIALAIIVAPITLLLECAAVLAGIWQWIFSRKLEFYIVEKNGAGSSNQPEHQLHCEENGNIVQNHSSNHQSAARVTAKAAKPSRVCPVVDTLPQNVAEIDISEVVVVKNEKNTNKNGDLNAKKGLPQMLSGNDGNDVIPGQKHTNQQQAVLSISIGNTCEASSSGATSSNASLLEPAASAEVPELITKRPRSGSSSSNYKTNPSEELVRRRSSSISSPGCINVSNETSGLCESGASQKRQPFYDSIDLS